MHRIHLFAIVALMLVLAACAPATGETADRPRTNPNLITQQEIQNSHQTTAYEVVRSLRPQWLRMRGTHSGQSGTIIVYYDDTRLGGLQTLQQIPTNTLVSLRFVDSVTATQRWGLDHEHGAIVASTRQAPR